MPTPDKFGARAAHIFETAVRQAKIQVQAVKAAAIAAHAQGGSREKLEIIRVIEDAGQQALSATFQSADKVPSAGSSQKSALTEQIRNELRRYIETLRPYTLFSAAFRPPVDPNVQAQYAAAADRLEATVDQYEAGWIDSAQPQPRDIPS